MDSLVLIKRFTIFSLGLRDAITNSIYIAFVITSILASSCKEQSECETYLDDKDWNYIEQVNRLIEEEQFLKASQINNEALLYNQNNYIAISNRGALLFKIKGHYVSREELGGMLDDFEQSLAICPDYLIANSNMITIASEFNLSDHVISYAIQRDSLEKLTSYHLTKLLTGYFHRGYYKDAVKAGESVLESEPQYTEAANYLGLTYIYMGNYGRAKTVLDQVIKDGRGNSLTYQAIALLNERLGDLSTAKKNYQRSIEKDSTELDSYLFLATIYQTQDSLEKACEIYKLASQNCNNLFEYSYSQAEVEGKINEICD